jgi:DNA-binding transcriptional LysR family regulator
MDRLRAFEVFVAVVAQGGFTRAADKLDTSPANVTRYVNDWRKPSASDFSTARRADCR